MKNLPFIALALGLASLAAGARADEFALKLKEAPGVEAVRNNCSACHSLDYVLMNSPFMDAKTWAGEVHKMAAVFGGAISADDEKTIADYLANNYGG